MTNRAAGGPWTCCSETGGHLSGIAELSEPNSSDAHHFCSPVGCAFRWALAPLRVNSRKPGGGALEGCAAKRFVRQRVQNDARCQLCFRQHGVAPFNLEASVSTVLEEYVEVLGACNGSTTHFQPVPTCPEVGGRRMFLDLADRSGDVSAGASDMTRLPIVFRQTDSRRGSSVPGSHTHARHRPRRQWMQCASELRPSAPTPVSIAWRRQLCGSRLAT